MGIVRQIKNVTGGYSSSQKLVRDITANDDSIPNRSDMREVAELTHEDHELIMIMDILDKRLNDKGKYWRHINKALMLLDYLVRNGSDGVVQWCHENLYLVKTLREYHHRDENGRELGSDIRKRAKDLTSLIMDRAKLNDVRSGRGRKGRPSRYREPEDAPRTPRRPNGAEDDDIARALELSKRTAAEEEEKRRMAGRTDNSLQSAYDLQMQNQAEANLLFQQQQQQAAAEEAALAQAQADYLAQQQLAQQEAQRLYEMQMAQQQQEAYLQQQLQQQQLQQLQMQQQQEELMRQQQQEQERQSMSPLKTGSNNPFAAFNAQQQQKQEAPKPAVPLETTPTGSKPRLHRQSTFDKEHMDRLDQILSLDAPMDTFGNTGMAKMPAQHTQNTGFVNSSGHGLTQTLTARRTGLSSNPFIPTGTTGQSPAKNNPQYTGIASTQMQPAHTGYGFGNANHSSSTNLIDL